MKDDLRGWMRALLVTGLAVLSACAVPREEPPAAQEARTEPAPEPVPEASPLPSPDVETIEPEEIPAPQAWQPPVSCGTALPGPPLPADTDEAMPGYVEAAAALDLSAVAEPFDFSGNNPFQRIL